MGLDLWFREDVARILSSVYETMRSATRLHPAPDPEGGRALAVDDGAPGNAQVAVAYQQGFVDALRAVSMAFGLRPVGATGEDGLEQSAPGALVQVRRSRDSS